MPTPQATERQRRYLELRLRRPASAWPVLRAASVAATIALCATLLLRPDTGLFAFWDLIVPTLPLLWLVAPGLWRNVCPMAATNQLPRILGISRGLRLPGWLHRHGYAVGVAGFLAVTASRTAFFESEATAVALLICGVLVLALAGGLAFSGKSGFCGSICPLRGVQGFYAQAPLVQVDNSHCRPCVGCTSNCPDLKPRTHLRDDLRDEESQGGIYRRLFVGAFPGFTLAFYVAPGVGLVLFSLASLGVFFLLESAARARAEQVASGFAAAAFATFYWFNVPVLAEGVGRLVGGAPPEWAIWEGRALAIGIGLVWLARGLRLGAATAASPIVELPMASVQAAVTAPPAPADTGLSEPEAPPRAQPLTDDSPVAVPDRRSKRRPMRYPEITVMPEGQRIAVAPGTSLLEVAQQAGLEVQAGCRMGLCGCDPVQILSGSESLSPPSDDEQATLDRLDFTEPTRMACCTRILGDAVVSLEPLIAAGAKRSAPAAASANGDGDGNGNGVAAPKIVEVAGAATNGSARANGQGRSSAAFKVTDSVRRVVIIGNGIAGVTAADHIRRHHAECEIDLVTDERHPFYNRTGISRLISSRGGVHKMYLLPDSWYDERRIAIWLNTRVARIDRQANQVVLGTGDVLPYDRLVLATGSSPFVPGIEGFGLSGSFCLRSADDAMMIRSFVQGEGARRALVAGGGVLGLEAADELRRLGLEVAVVERDPWLAPAQIDARGGRLLAEHIQRRGIEVVLDRTIKAISGTDRVQGVELSDGTSRTADLVLVCAGVRPNTRLAAEAGLEVSTGVVVDSSMRTSDKRIFAAGDVAEHEGRSYGVWPAAVEQAEIAAISALGASKRYSGSTVPIRLKLAGVDLTSIGRPRAELDGDVEIAIEHPDGERYRKLVVSEGRIAGAVLLGHPEHSAAVLAASREERDVRGHLDALRSGDWGVLNETHFEQAVAAPLNRHANGSRAPLPAADSAG